MAWVYANTGEDYVGETHTLGGTVYSGKTRTPESRRLIEVPDAPKPAPKPAPKKAPVKKGKSK